MLKRFLVMLGASADESPLFYRDVGLGMLFVPAVLVILVLGFERKFSAVFWISIVVAGTALHLAAKRRMLVGALFGFAAIRFAFVGIISANVLAVVGALACAAVGIAILLRAKDDYL